MSEMKPCPFCGSEPYSYHDNDTDFEGVKCNLGGCACSDIEIDEICWNSRPIEDALNNRIAELEADSVQIQYICEDELPEGISDEVFSAMYACSTVDFVRVYPYITIDGHKRFLVELPEATDADN